MNTNSKLLVGSLFLGGAAALAHNGLDHHKPVQASSPQQNVVIAEIAKSYSENVEPIFRRSCANCHGFVTEYPWYHVLPGAKQLIDSDISESREHIEMSKGFPFGGHGTPAEDLKAIEHEVKSGEMPPLQYRLFHWSSRLTDDEIATIVRWTTEGQAKLESARSPTKTEHEEH